LGAWLGHHANGGAINHDNAGINVGHGSRIAPWADGGAIDEIREPPLHRPIEFIAICEVKNVNKNIKSHIALEIV